MTMNAFIELQLDNGNVALVRKSSILAVEGMENGCRVETESSDYFTSTSRSEVEELLDATGDL